MPLSHRSSSVRALLSFGTCLALAVPADAGASPPGFEFPEWPVAEPGARAARPAARKSRARKAAPVAAPQAPADASAGSVASGSDEPGAAAPDAQRPDESEASRSDAPQPDASASGSVTSRADESSASGSEAPRPDATVAAEVAAPAEPVGPAPAPAIPGRDATRAGRARRVAAAQVLTGVALTAGGLVGAGVMASGLYLHRSAERELARGAAGGYPDELLAPLYTQRQRGETMLAAGAVAGALGLAVGLALLGTGARDLKAARAGRMARLRVAPTFGGVVFSGRF